MNTDRTAVLTVEDRAYRYLPLGRVLPTAELDSLPYAIRVLLENVARRAPESLADLVARARAGRGGCEVPVHPNRIMLHDTTCLPALADFAAMRDSVAELGGAPGRLQPSIPVDLTVDHSVIVEEYGRPDAVERNLLIDFRRNGERYEMVKWAERSLRGFRVVPPGTGIIHQVNMEVLARVVWTTEAEDAGPPWLHPDVLVATDSHTPMINALGVVGWGVGGLEGQAAMLGEPVTIPYPEVVGVRLTGRLRQGVGATDLALTLTELLRATGVVDKFVEFCGDGVTTLGWAERAAVSNMAPEYGATCVFFPYDDETAAYLRLTGREEEHVRLVDAYLAAQGLKRTDDRPVPRYDQLLDLDLGTVEPSVAGPDLPHQRLPLSRVPASYRGPRVRTSTGAGDLGEPQLPEGPVAIAAITSCTHTANPALVVQAGLLAQRAARWGLTARPWVKTSLSPGSRVVDAYLRASGLLPALEQTGFHIVGFGCMTCIGNSGPLHPELERLAQDGAVEPVAVLSGNRNFAGRVNPRISQSYLASPPLVVAYALAGSVLHDFDHEAIGTDPEGRPVLLKDLWPSDEEVADYVAEFVRPEMFRANAARIRRGTRAWREIEAPGGTHFRWAPESTYIRRPPHLTHLSTRPPAALKIDRAKVLLRLGDDVTTDHISPAGSIPADSAAGRWLTERGVARRDLNQYSTRRSNHEVMLRGAFTNPAVRNLLLTGRTAPAGHAYTADGSDVLPVHLAAPTYRDAGYDLVVVAGRNYGAGSSRDWAAKAQALLGVRAVIAESYERIHRSNLIGMGVLPLEFAEGDHASSCHFTADMELSFEGLDPLRVGTNRVVLQLRGAEGGRASVDVWLRVFSRQELAYLRHGGVLPYVVRRAL
ncbi:aconitate hydratase AcnA [Streptomyces lanatus]|uniref:Aconitate hydratase n=1 Tax=Streptomyces lanatus TaxID=66900 RepID=A0ABV1XLU3_9ACTN|nr:aconitate hydratase AcnA [Streptomyces lanatus]GHG99667.1 aconitate hydratase [Streptomyces lanatus]